MSAQFFAEGYVTRFVECACEITRLEHSAENRCGIARIGTQVAVSEIPGRE